MLRLPSSVMAFAPKNRLRQVARWPVPKSRNVVRWSWLGLTSDPSWVRVGVVPNRRGPGRQVLPSVPLWFPIVR